MQRSINKKNVTASREINLVYGMGTFLIKTYVVFCGL
jgi:hypothetical protein